MNPLFRFVLHVYSKNFAVNEKYSWPSQSDEYISINADVLYYYISSTIHLKENDFFNKSIFRLAILVALSPQVSR